MPSSLRVGGMKFLDLAPDVIGVSAYLVERHETLLAIECGVLQALGHHGTAVLLKLHRTAKHGVATEATARFADQFARQQRFEKVEHARIEIRPVRARLIERGGEVVCILFGKLTFTIDIRA